MRRIILLILCATVAGLSASYGQMPAAQRVPPAIDKKVKLNAPADRVWEYISNPGNYKEFSRVKEFWYEGSEPESKIVLTNRRGLKRNQTIGMVVPQIKAISYMVAESDYSTDKQWVYRFDVTPDGKGKCVVELTVYFGFDELPDDMKKGLSEEFDDIVSGLKKKFK